MSRSILLLGVASCLLGACSKSESSATSPASSSPITDAAGSAPDDPAKFEKLGNAVASCKMKPGLDFGIDPTCPDLKAYEAARVALKPEESRTVDAAVAPKFLSSTAPSVRALGTTYLSSVMGADVASSDMIASAMEKESDLTVLSHMIRMAGPAADQSEKVAAAIVKAAGHADKNVRFHAAVILANAKIPGASAKLIELADKDPEREVQDLACASLGQHGEAALVVLEKRTSDSRAPGYGPCFIGLVRQWSSFPRFDTSSEKAYKLTLQRITQKPHGDQAPPFTALQLIAQLGDDTPDANAWRKKNTWFKPEAMVKALGEVITDPMSGYAPRTGAIDAAVKHGATKSELQAWRKTFGTPPPDHLVKIAEKLDDAIAKAKK